MRIFALDIPSGKGLAWPLFVTLPTRETFWCPFWCPSRTGRWTHWGDLPARWIIHSWTPLFWGAKRIFVLKNVHGLWRTGFSLPVESGNYAVGSVVLELLQGFVHSDLTIIERGLFPDCSWASDGKTVWMTYDTFPKFFHHVLILTGWPKIGFKFKCIFDHSSRVFLFPSKILVLKISLFPLSSHSVRKIFQNKQLLRKWACIC